ncbi:MAG: ComF family protein [Elusimicrobia bacterium]|nr:ComF family protein [Elusimicrobiota bacterium]
MDTATISQAVLHLLWPVICAHCREDLPKNHQGPLCLACRQKLVPHEPPYCWRCADRVPSGQELCLRCEDRPHECRLIRAVFQYKDAAVSLVHAFKFRGRRSAARTAGTWMGFALDRYPELEAPDALVPMPMHPARRRERGYNQASLLAETLSAVAQVPVEELVSRKRATKPQWALGREQRAKNLDGAFCVCAPEDKVKGKRLLLIDDVCTSGSSFESCAKVLNEAGASWVGGYALVRQSGRAT